MGIFTIEYYFKDYFQHINKGLDNVLAENEEKALEKFEKRAAALFFLFILLAPRMILARPNF